MKLKNTFLTLLLSMLIIGILSGCGGASSADSSAPDPYAGLTTYDTNNGLTILMQTGFTKEHADGQPYYQSDNCSARFLKEDFESFEALGYSREMSLEEYAALILQAYGLEGEVLTDDYDNVYITYAQVIQDIDFTYYNFYAKGGDAFWTANFVCATEQKADMEPQFQLWASTITVP